MTGEQFDLIKLYANAFGSTVKLPLPGAHPYIARVNILGKYSDLHVPIEVKLAQGFNVGNVPEVKPGLRSSILGTPIFMPVQIDGYWLPNEPLIEISGGIEVVKEPKAGGRGTFKENMGMEDYDITIRGIAINEDEIDEYPEEIVARLRQLGESGKPLKVLSPLFRIFGIDQVIIEKHRYPATEGMYSAQAYEFQCLSDENVELELIDETDGGI